MSLRILLSALTCITLIVVGCVPAGQVPAQDGGQSSPSVGKVLRIGTTAPDEPDPARGGIGFNTKPAGHIFHSGLAAYDPTTAELQPRIAERVPTIETGDWRSFPEGSMDLTWKLRSNAVWHDGVPLTAEDFIFGLKVALDGEVFARGTGILRSIAELEAPDPHTLVVRWKETYIFANAMLKDTLVPLPRHLLQDLYDAGDKQAFAASPYHTTAWIGVGPYRLSQWLQGSYMEAEAFDRYFLGRPKVDRISIRFFADSNVLLATVLAGDVDVVPQGGFKQEEAQVLKAEWEPKGMGSVILTFTDLRHAKPQWRNPEAPWVQDVRVRRALAHLLDRQSMVDTLKSGLSSVGDIPLPAEDSIFRLAQQRGIPSYPYDVSRAHRLFAEAGLTRGQDGIYRTPNGDPFTAVVAASADIGSQSQELLVITDQWKSAGIDATPFPVPPSSDLYQNYAQTKGFIVRGLQMEYARLTEFTTREITSEANRWSGRNYGGYSNPAFDQLVSRLMTTLDRAERDQVGADLMKMALDEVVWIPLYYGPDVIVAGKNVRNVTKVMPAQDVVAWNVHVWEMN